MPVTTSHEPIPQIAADALVIGLHSDSRPSGPAAAFDEASSGLLSRLLDAKEITGKKLETLALLAPPGIRASAALVVGLGPKTSFDRGLAFRAASAAARTLAGKERSRVAFCLADNWPTEIIQAAVAGSTVGCIGQDLYRAKKNRHPISDIVWSGIDAAAANQGAILGDAVNLARRLVNEPPSEIYPESFAAQAASIATACGLTCEIWDKARLQAERCGSLLAVAAGSSREPRLLILKYNGAPADTKNLSQNRLQRGEQAHFAPSTAQNEPVPVGYGIGTKPLALVGKGVTFDSGGLSIKPTDGMKTMKCDMAGAAAVVGAMQAIARLQLPVNVIGLCGLVENMLSGDSYKLGDVLKARSGKTIEVLNTDAEGRLVLADVLDVTLEHQPSKIVDLATLTGACVVALGNDVAGLMTNHQDWANEVKAAGDATGEPLWQLPMFSEFGEQIRSEVADIKNVGDGRWGGAITAAKFLEEFVGTTPWVHLDIAGPAFLESSKPWLDAGGTGFAVRTLVELAKSMH